MKRYYKKLPREFFKTLREKSEREYSGIPALNWGETIDDEYVIPNRYFFDWSTVDKNKNFKRIDGDVKKYILDFISKVEKEDRSVEVFLGVDSQNRVTETRYAAVIALHVERNGVHEVAAKFNATKIYDYRYRLLREADMLGEIGREFVPFFEENNIPYNFHLDYNESTNHKSNGIVTEATNYLKHLGFEAKIKPEAWAASCAADYLC